MGKIIAFRPKAKDADVSPHLLALKEAGIGKNDSDRIRLALVAYAEQRWKISSVMVRL